MYFLRKQFGYASLIAILVIVFIFFNSRSVLAIPDHSFPRTANYYLHWSLTEAQARELAKWDLLILDMETQATSRELLKKIRQWNPDIILLAYITPQEIKRDSGSSALALRRELAGGLKEQWYLKNSQGQKLSWWAGTDLLNVSNDSPVVGGQRFNQYLSKFVADKLLATGLWDGVFYDNAWDSITHFVGSDIDFNLDGLIDSQADTKWREGMKFIYNETRRLAGNKYLIVGNGTTREYLNELNGKMIENFIPQSWGSTMQTYAYNFNGDLKPTANIINANTGNRGGEANYQLMRFGLASALLEDGYYSFDYGDQNHGQLWQYDEYGVNLGQPAGEAISKNNYQSYQPDVWQRDFANGLVIANSTNQQQAVGLDGEYEKIHGAQDKEINDGSIISETAIDGYDGLILLKTFAVLNDVLFRNGDFVRFFNAQGERVRNGFFVFESGYKGGDKIAHLDLDGNGKRDLLVVSKNKIMAWRDDGQIFMKVYPYTVNYQGELRVAIGDLNKDGLLEVYVAPSAGYPAPIKIYTRHGRQMKRDWYPFGEKYQGGYSLAVRSTNDFKNELLIGAGQGAKPEVFIYDYNYNLIKQWLAFEMAFKGGVNLASGDLDGDKIDEIIAGAGPGKKPLIRVFSKDGQQLSEFTAYETLNKPGIEVMSLDVDYDGKDDIAAMSNF